MIELSVLALRLRIKPIGSDRVTRRAETGHNLLARNVELLRGDNYVFSGGGTRRCRRWWCGAR
ncbi:MAG: hypothetical protein DMF34_12105 [Verrucomicrobia bacterium]|nr:MAG: hypothetical protein DMF34_12105 [Verrucomicrobiota bacterium]